MNPTVNDFTVSFIAVAFVVLAFRAFDLIRGYVLARQQNEKDIADATRANLEADTEATEAETAVLVRANPQIQEGKR